MKKLILIAIAASAICVGGMSLFDSNPEFTQFHTDDIDGINAPEFTGNPPAGKTGAPFESSCTDCHAGSVIPAAGVVDFTLGGFAGGYYPGTTYPVTIGSTTGTKNGFQVVAVDASEAQAGTFTAGSNSNITSSSSRDYVRQTSAVGATTWSFDWQAPATDIGDITFYYSYNISDESTDNTGDEVYVGEMTISVAGDVSVSEYDELKNAYSVRYDVQNQSVIANYTNPDNNRVLFVVQNMVGQEVKRIDAGHKAPGDYQETFDLTEVDAEGIYLVSVFIGNRALTKKVYVGS